MHGLNWVPYQQGGGKPLSPGVLATGGNGGYQALGLALMFGAARVILLGYDMGATGGRLHWHRDHGGKLHNPEPHKFRDWIAHYNKLAGFCPVPIINCSRESALKCFPRMGLDEGLAGPA